MKNNSNKNNTAISVDSTEQYHLIMEAPASIAILEGPDHTFKSANEMYFSLVGKDRQVIGMTVKEAFPELKDQGFYELLDGVYNSQKSFVGQETPITLVNAKSGESEHIFINLIYKAIIDNSGNSTGIFVHATDVTESVENRQKVETSQRRYQSLLNTIDEGFCVIEVLFDAYDKACDYRFIETNQVFEQQTGLKNSLNKRVKELQPDLEADWFEVYGKVAKSGEPVRFSQGSEAMGRWFDVFASKLESYNDIDNLVAVLFRDISDSKRAELELQNQKNLVQTITDNITVALCTVDVTGRVLFMNPAACKITGYDTSKAIGKSFHNLVHHSKQDGSPFPESECKLSQTYAAGEPFPETEVTFFKQNGSSFPAKVLSTPLGTDNAIQGSVIEFRDLSDEKNAQLKVTAATKRQTQLEKTTLALQQQRLHLMQLNDAKDEFISLASHQLRTPATGVKQYLGILLQGYVGELTESQKEMATKAYNTNERELTIVEDLLRVAQIDAGKIKVTANDVDVHELIQDTLDGFSEKALQKNISLNFLKRSSNSTCTLDEKLMRMVLENLVDNALKYTADDGEVTVTYTSTKSNAILTVNDTGIGIADDDKTKLFKKFSRVNHNSAAEVAGNGLGLYWVKQVVDLHDGTVKVSDNTPHGSIFTINLPQ